MASSPFKAIVVGCGPIGLVAAHALYRSGIDFVLLESRPSAVTDVGLGLVLNKLGLNSLYQLGLYDRMQQVTGDLSDFRTFDHSGNHIADMQWFKLSKEHFGEYPQLISRYDLTKILYEALPLDIQGKIHTSKQVSDVKTTASGVEVSCKDGSSYTGSLVIGADGAHSVVRDQMRRLAITSNSPNINDEQPFLSTYRCLWMRFPTSDRALRGTTTELHGLSAATQTFVGPDSTAICGMYERLETPTRDRVRYTTADEEAMVARWGHLPVLKGLTLKQAFDSAVRTGVVSLEEGVVPHWSHAGRVVLVGDAAHKFTPSTGDGCNNGILDVVVLVNALARTIDDHPATEPPQAAVARALEEYQDARFDQVRDGCSRSGNATAMSTWTTGVHKFLDRQVFSWKLFQRYLYGRGAKQVHAMPRFAFADRPNTQFMGAEMFTPVIKV